MSTALQLAKQSRNNRRRLGLLERDSSPWIEKRGGVAGYRRLYDLYDVTATTLKIRSFSGMDAILGGQVKMISAGGAWVFDAAITIAAACYLYLEWNLTTNLLYGRKEAAFPAGTDTLDYYPLWYIGWDSGNSRISGPTTVDLRDCVREGRL